MVKRCQRISVWSDWEVSVACGGPRRALLGGIEGSVNLASRHRLSYPGWTTGCGAANLSEATLHGVNVTEATLHGVNLTEAGLRGANLTEANLCRASLTGASLDEATLTGADLSAADLGLAKGLTQEQLNGAIGNKRTRLPSGRLRPESWSPRRHEQPR